MSVLNPEAPEFYPHLKSVTKQDGFATVRKTIRSSVRLPSGASKDLFETYTSYNVVTCKLRGEVNNQSSQVISIEIPAVNFRNANNEYNTEKVTDANDLFLDRVNVTIDTITGANRPSDPFISEAQASWNNTPLISKIKEGHTTFIGAKNLPRPQLMFKDTIDNSNTTLFVPKISDKPNSLRPLSLNIRYNEQGEAVGYEHPYQLELDSFEPLPEWLEAGDTDPEFPRPLEETPLTIVDTEEALNNLVEHLTTVSELAVDVEHHSYRTYQGITCLIQITTDEGGDFLIDTLAIREHIHKLNVIFTDPTKLKVLHGAESDVLWLQRDFGLYIVGLFDTYQASRELKSSQLSLKMLLFKYCNIRADKKHQLADWRIRPLPEELVHYARSDTHYLLYVWRRLRQDLIVEGGMHSRLVRAVFTNSTPICAQTYNKPVLDETSHLNLYVRSRKSFDSRQMAALRLLFSWRDAHAREVDESTSYLLPNHMMLTLADVLPREVQGVNACCNPMPPFVKQNLITLHRMILSCRELPLEPQLLTIPNSLKHHDDDPYKYYMDLKKVHDFEEEPQDLPIDEYPILEIIEDNDQGNREVILVPILAQTVLKAVNTIRPVTIVSELNADAKLFVPPYDRYKKYRSLAQNEELKEFREKEARVAAISKGNELIKKEVLDKMQQAKQKVETESAADNIKKDIVVEIKTETTLDKKKDNTKLNKKEKKKQAKEEALDNHEKRKRKMSGDKNINVKPEIKTPDPPENKTRNAKNSEKNKPNTTKGNTKPNVYTNANYSMFFDDENNSNHKTDKKTHRQPRMKFKKHK